MVYIDPEEPTSFVGLTEEIISSEEKLEETLSIIERLKFREACTKESKA